MHTALAFYTLPDQPATMYVCLQIITTVCSSLPELCSKEDWTSVRRCLQLLLWWCQQVPGAAEDFVSAKGAVRVQGEQ
jgi:hypothetical protein